MITPEITDVTEYLPFNISYSIEPVDPLLPPILESVTVTASDGKDYSKDLNIVIQSDLSFSISGTLSDIFDRQMDYLDKFEKPQSTKRFKDIPLDFSTLYRYKGPMINSVDLTVTVNTDQGTETSTIIVNNNYAVANSKLQQYVALGKY